MDPLGGLGSNAVRARLARHWRARAARRVMPEVAWKILGNPRFPLKGSFKGDVDIGIDIDIDVDIDALWGLSKST